jgi:DNA-binding transcriptional ArsR family regulator
MLELRTPVSNRTRQRDKSRSGEQIVLLELARDLSFLAQQYERFAPDLNRLVMRIKYQVRTPTWKRRIIERALRPRGEPIGPLSIEEICEETMLDRTSVVNELPRLLRAGVIEVVDRCGRRPDQRHQGGKWTRYYRAAAGPSGELAKRG